MIGMRRKAYTSWRSRREHSCANYPIRSATVLLTPTYQRQTETQQHRCSPNRRSYSLPPHSKLRASTSQRQSLRRHHIHRPHRQPCLPIVREVRQHPYIQRPRVEPRVRGARLDDVLEALLAKGLGVVAAVGEVVARRAADLLVPDPPVSRDVVMHGEAEATGGKFAVGGVEARHGWFGDQVALGVAVCVEARAGADGAGEGAGG